RSRGKQCRRAIWSAWSVLDFLSNLAKPQERKTPLSQRFLTAPAGICRQFKRCQRALQQTAARAASPGSNRIDKPALVLDWPIEQRRHASHRACRMRVRARNLCHPKMARDLEREHILVLTARAVEHLDRIDHLEDFEPGRPVRIGRIDRFRVRVDKRKARVELVAEWMIRDQYPAFEVHHAPQFGELVDSSDVPLEPERA